MAMATLVVLSYALGLAVAAPAPQVPGYTGADAPYRTQVPPPLSDLATTFGPDSTIPAIHTSDPTPPPLVSSNFEGPTSHGPYEGTPTTIGAVSTHALGWRIPSLGPKPWARYYNRKGKLTRPQPIPYQPAGGLGTKGFTPRYMVESDFDFESIALGVYQEFIELDCFNNGVATFSADDFIAAGLGPEAVSLIQFMAQQEEGHASLLSNMLGERAPKQCTYNYPYTTVREFIDFNQVLTGFGESGVLGFKPHLNSREVDALLSQSIATEGRQQMIFRQMLGLHPMPVWFEAGIPQSWAWTYIAPYISSCPEGQTRLAWQNFPPLHVVNQANPNRFSPNDTAPWEVVGRRTSDPGLSTIPQKDSCVNLNETGHGCGPAIARNRSEPLSFAGKLVNLTWDEPGAHVGPNNSYVTAVARGCGPPRFVLWVAQLNATYTPLTVTGRREGYTYQPATEVYAGDAVVNGTMFVALTDRAMPVTPFNLANVNPHVRALGIYKAG